MLHVGKVNIPLSGKQQIEGFNRARDFFRESEKRRNDVLRTEGCFIAEEYLSGRLALVLYCDLPIVGIAKPDSTGLVHHVERVANFVALLILKADIAAPHVLRSWDEKTMLVGDIQMVQGPDGTIPTKVGFNVIANEIDDWTGDLLLFECTFQPGYKLIPRIKDWKPCPIRSSSAASDNCIDVKDVQSTPKIVKRIADYQGSILDGELSYFEAQEICSSLRVVINAHGVEVRSIELGQERSEITDVLLGPLNLFV